MRRVAASVVILQNDTLLINHVVELYNHTVVNYYPLIEEIEMTEWLGGSIIISENRAYHFQEILSVNDKQELNIKSKKYL
ncbi:MAG: hypothetical protein MJZ41_09140 [Bacteroidaceae bacterium]|nr:hypothetical protein [Bacteroidaceae bacterium]